MEEIKIDLDRIRKALPNRATVSLKRSEKGTCSIECCVQPALEDEDFEMCKQFQREIIGQENISEFYTEVPGRFWIVYLERKVIEFTGVSDDDINEFARMKLVKDGALIK